MLEDPRVNGLLWIVVICVLVPGALWYLAVRRRRPQLKLWAAAVEVTALIVLGIDLGQTHCGRFVPDTYETTAVGPARREATPSVAREWPYPVNADEAGRQHLLEFTPVARAGEQAAGPLILRYEVRSPKGEIVAQGRETVMPAQGDKWSTLRTQFQPRDEGEHTMLLEIPKPAGEVKVKIRVLK